MNSAIKFKMPFLCLIISRRCSHWWP